MFVLGHETALMNPDTGCGDAAAVAACEAEHTVTAVTPANPSNLFIACENVWRMSKLRLNTPVRPISRPVFHVPRT
jgi:hypothetical protein